MTFVVRGRFAEIEVDPWAFRFTRRKNLSSGCKLPLNAVVGPRKLLQARCKPQALQSVSLAFDNGDVYLLRQIFHSWDFENSVKILKNTVQSMGQNSHVLIMDFVVPEPGTVSSVNERVLRSRDVGMMQLVNSLERDLEGWKAILEAVDSRLTINAVNTPYGSFMSVIDVVLG